MHLNVQESATGITITLAGDVGIETVEDLRDRLLHALDSAEQVLLDCAGVSSAHVAALQLLCAAHRYAAAQHKTLCMQEMSANMRANAELSGFCRHASCLPCDAQNCLWQEGGSDG